LSGIFKHVKRLGCISGVNPMQDVSIPKSRPAGQTYAYSLEEITRMISILPQPAATVVVTAAFTGMRRGEIRGFLWENYTPLVWELADNILSVGGGCVVTGDGEAASTEPRSAARQ
jgi:hypothetical protein